MANALTHSFNAHAWLAAWEAAGGVVVRTADRLTLARPGYEMHDAEACRLRAIGLLPVNAEAIIAVLDARHRGEVSA
ncbi:hypothetical protein NED98_05690 [Sphingomonas sp. MMSM20]|uniref:hypothetical protein n=1 Tax=Sphingomonas lycopersici TaxID=2951807 RepID=UPI002238CB73|nr:hypothetical protein [Sphingomonas lycopersici]MCW6529732.1 hypothetical protein [Sphingomonas lycopersici]